MTRQTQSQFELSPTEVLRTLFRHKKKALLFAGTIMTAGILFTLLGPKTYWSESKLFIRLGRENSHLDPIATTGQVVQFSESRESEMNSILEMLKSRALLESVVDHVGPQVVLGDSWSLFGTLTAPFQGTAPRAGSEEEKLEQAKLRDKAVLVLAKTVRVSTPRKSNVVNISCEADSPKLAQQIVSQLVESYQQQHGNAHHTDGSLAFFQAQTTECQAVLTSTATKLRDTKNKIGLATMAEQQQILSKRIGLLQEQLSATLSDAAAANAAVVEMKSNYEELEKTSITQQEDGHPNQAVDLMRSQLYALQLKEQELLSLYNPDFPAVVEIGRQIAKAQEILNTQEPKRKVVTQGINQSREQLHLASLNEEAKACSLQTKAETLKSHLDEALAEMRTLNDEEIKLAQLEREMVLADSHFRKYSEHLEQARIDQALHSQQISNVNVVQPASYVLKPVSPKKLINLALTTVIAVIGSVLLALAAERLDRSLKSPRDVAAHLELPVLVSIPRFKGHHQNGFTKARIGDFVSR